MKYNNIISLGYFCSTAMEIERLGLRSASYPFDWIVSEDFENVINLIENNFEGFLKKENLIYDKFNFKYIDKETKIAFFHDFSEKNDFDSDFEQVKCKYARRIERFYNTIKQPTLLIRYISDQNEYNYIAENYNNISELFKTYNSNNEIVFVSNDTIRPKSVKVYKVNPDHFDTVARKFLNKNIELKEYILRNISYDPDIIRENKKRYKRNLIKRTINKGRLSIRKIGRKLFRNF